MGVVITLFAIMTMSCVLGFQSAQITFKLENAGGSTLGDYEYTITDDDDRFTMEEIKWKIPAGETKTSKKVTVLWYGYNQEIKEAKFKTKLSYTGGSGTGKITLKKDIKAGLETTEIDFSNKDHVKSRD